MNKYAPHIYILPEDDAYRQIANGFRLEIENFGMKSQVMPLAKGWTKVRDNFVEEYKDDITKYSERYIIMLVDFDNDERRLAAMQAQIPVNCTDRVFVLSVWSEAEKLNTDLGSIGYEEIGRRLAKECLSGNYELWNHPLLRRNADEAARMESILKPIFFP